MNYTSINPFNNTQIESFELLSTEEIASCLGKAQSAYKTWKYLDYNSRASHLLRLANLLVNQKQTLAQLITEEMGKPLAESMAEIEKSVIACEYYAYQAEDMLKQEDVYTDASLSYIKYEPLGAILGIMPWNYPIWQVIRFIAPTLMAGNVCLLKPAPNMPRCTLYLADLIQNAEFPVGVFQTLFINIGHIESVIAHSIVRAVSLTGSTIAGQSVASLAGKYLKKCVLELGGSDPFIVLPSANVELAVENAIKSRLINNGQSCIAAKRFIVHDKVLDTFTQRLVENLNLVNYGDPKDENVSCGPMARLDLAQMVIKQADECIKRGAKLLFGSLELKGNLLKPIVLSEITNKMPAYNEEIFGPVFSIIAVSTVEQAIEVANDSQYGLSASVWTNDHTIANIFIDQLEVGAVFINGISRSDVRLPFGGVKNSGFGRELSALGIKEFTNAKTVWIKNN